MIIELGLFRLNKGVTDEEVMTEIEKTTEHFLKKQPGFIDREVGKDSEGNWMDYLHWESLEDAQASAEKFMTSEVGEKFMEQLDMSEAKMFYYEKK